MTHIVIHDDGVGQTQYCQFDDLESAVAYLEQRRNHAGVDNAKLYELAEVHFEVKPYYRVEVVSESPVSSPVPAASVFAEAVAAPMDFANFGASEIGEPAESSVASPDGRRGLFGR